ncbi:TonB-dependent receptor [Chitinophagaceae bacterium LB-8]|uniref:TonB-dependent receptor n=1 Tax=Paraflavisolibacter caeni TaxID=2982496 RepID=A0A9X2Y019_9BACT|nr:TonB-dependent receptor [Paraflavisolibacter caeni]MCU7550638.1 TonB-dependent receptor [Paraflavisolibacter caeni]
MIILRLLRGLGMPCFFLLFSLYGFAQSFPVSGKITGADGQPLAGVSIQVKGSNAGTTTKADGTFTITVPSAQSILVFSSIGYTSQEASVNGKSAIAIALKSADNNLQDVVVVGYGTRKKSDVTGAVSSISGEKLRTVQTTNLTQSLQGRIAGVEATPSGFRPGTGSSIRLRGNRSLSASNEPLYVVDGFPVSYTIDDMNPADIESVDILKDASATAIYGVRGANGVVQITTKKGKAGKISVNYQGSQSIESIIRPIQVFDASQLVDAQRQAFFADSLYTRDIKKRSATNSLYYYPDALSDMALFRNRFGSEEQWNSIKDAYTWEVYDPVNKIYRAKKRATTPEEKALLQNLQFMGGMRTDSIDIYDPSRIKSYDWLDNVGIRNGSTTNHSISVTGGSDRIKSSFSAGYFNQKGIEYGQDYTRYSIGASNDFKAARYLTFGISVNYTNATTNTSTSSYGNAIGMIPMVTPYDSAGNWVLIPNKDDQIRSAINDHNTVFDETKTNRIFGNVYGELTLFKGLKYRTMFGLDTRNSRQGKFDGSQSSIQLGSPAKASRTIINASSWVYDNILTYNTTIKSNHTINVTLLQELQNLNRTDTLIMSANNLIFESQKWYSLNRNTDALVTGSGSYAAARYMSYMGRVEYGFRNKYLLTVSNRYDNSSVLSEGNKGAWFPSASVAWQIDRENFFRSQSVLNSAKLRMGIGKVGNASIPPYQTGGPLAFTNYNWGNGQAAIGSAPLTFKTPDLGWEKTTTTNVGIDFGLLKNRINGVIDLYKSTTTDQLQQRSIPTANGVGYLFFNLGKVENKGIEVTLNTQNIVSRDFRWSTDFVFTKNKEKIVDIDGSGNSNYANLWLIDQPLQVYWGYKQEGIFQYSDTAKGGALADYYWKKSGNKGNVNYLPGRIKIFDANGDTAMSPADRIVLGSHNPDFTASIGNTLSYKNFDLNFLIHFHVGGLYRVPRPSLVGRYQTFEVNYWTPSNPSNEYQQPTSTSDIPFGWEAITYTKATYAKVKNITLSYRVPQQLTGKANINNLSFYISAVNPILIHGYSTYDPETVPYKEFPGSTTNNTGPTSYSYRSYVIGAKLDL